MTAFSLPLALLAWRWPSAWQWAGFLVCGVLGSAGHYCLTRSFEVAEISATQSLRFLDLVWAPLIGGALISATTVWVVRREARRAARDRVSSTA